MRKVSIEIGNLYEEDTRQKKIQGVFVLPIFLPLFIKMIVI